MPWLCSLLQSETMSTWKIKVMSNATNTSFSHIPFKDISSVLPMKMTWNIIDCLIWQIFLKPSINKSILKNTSKIAKWKANIKSNLILTSKNIMYIFASSLSTCTYKCIIQYDLDFYELTLKYVQCNWSKHSYTDMKIYTLLLIRFFL